MSLTQKLGKKGRFAKVSLELRRIGMPLFDFLCMDCGETSELLIAGSGERPRCKTCGGHNLKKLLSAHSSLSGPNKNRMPGPGDTACCGLSPGQADCAGPGSCCGKRPV